MAVLSAVGVHLDPILNHNFIISLLDTSSTLALLKSIAVSAVFDLALGGFMECSGLEMTLEVKDYEEGGRNGAVLKFPTRVKWTNISLKQGIGAGQGLWDWHNGFAEGKGKRKDGVIMLLNDLHLPNNIWYFKRGLPVKYTAPPMIFIHNTAATETIEIAHEGIYQVPYVGYGTAAVSFAIGQAVK